MSWAIGGYTYGRSLRFERNPKNFVAYKKTFAHKNFYIKYTQTKYSYRETILVDEDRADIFFERLQEEESNLFELSWKMWFQPAGENGGILIHFAMSSLEDAIKLGLVR